MHCTFLGLSYHGMIAASYPSMKHVAYRRENGAFMMLDYLQSVAGCRWCCGEMCMQLVIREDRSSNWIINDRWLGIFRLTAPTPPLLCTWAWFMKHLFCTKTIHYSVVARCFYDWHYVYIDFITRPSVLVYTSAVEYVASIARGWTNSVTD